MVQMVHDGRWIGDVCEQLAKLQPGLMLDIGAAAGFMTRRMLKHSPDSRVIAFEPFPGNIPYFQEIVGSDDRVTFIQAAVCDRNGRALFHVKSTVPEDATGPWAKVPGYSLVGQLEEVASAPEQAQMFEVDTVSVDEIIGDEAVLFCKMDVQGAALQVLRGASRALSEGRVGLLLIEFQGDARVFELLQGFELFDSEYWLIKRPRGESHISAWEVAGEQVLSTGRNTLRGWPLRPDRENYPEWFRSEKKKMVNLWTDLIASRPDLVATIRA